MKNASDAGCLSTDAALSFARGNLAPAALQALDAHLDACADCQRLVVEAVRGMNSERLAASEVGGRTVFEANALVGSRYRIRRFLARGGMGEVYEAWDLELDAPVALKTVATPVSDSPRALRYLKAEVLHTRRIAHPNVCRIYDWGSHRIEGSTATIHFLTMEFIEGRSLAKHLRAQGALAVHEVEAISKELLAGLGAAHAAGILHRDFKSDNVMLRGTPYGHTPVILDFGLAHPIDRDSQSSSRGPAGTMVYMAPEQLEGKKLAPSADLYAFGVVCFEMLTGKRPFEDANGVEAPFERLRTAPQPPSRQNPAVPEALDDIVLACLEREPLDRFQTAEEVLAAFERLQHSAASSRKGRRGALRVAALLPVAAVVTYVWMSASGAHAPEPRASSAKLQAARVPPLERTPQPELTSSARTLTADPPAGAREPKPDRTNHPTPPAGLQKPRTDTASVKPKDAAAPTSSARAAPAIPGTTPSARAPAIPGWERIQRPL